MYLPFEVTKAERQRLDDPRPSIRERYPTRAVYLSKMTEAALELQRDRFLLNEDVVEILNIASQRQYWTER